MTEFHKAVYNIVKSIPRGKVLTYGEVAKRLGDKKLARAVGNALNKNHDKEIPCHRVVRGSGRVGGFNRGIKNKIKILEREGVKIKNGKIL